jgi:hypothetical protein
MRIFRTMVLSVRAPVAVFLITTNNTATMITIDSKNNTHTPPREGGQAANRAIINIH